MPTASTGNEIGFDQGEMYDLVYNRRLEVRMNLPEGIADFTDCDARTYMTVVQVTDVVTSFGQNVAIAAILCCGKYNMPQESQVYVAVRLIEGEWELVNKKGVPYGKYPGAPLEEVMSLLAT